jgi:hypothetical protein
MLYEVAPETAVQEIVVLFAPPVALTPVGTAGAVGAGAGVRVVAATWIEASPSPTLLTAVTT